MTLIAQDILTQHAGHRSWEFEVYISLDSSSWFSPGTCVSNDVVADYRGKVGRVRLATSATVYWV